jgi:MFS family permease
MIAGETESRMKGDTEVPSRYLQPLAGALTDSMGPRRTVTAFLVVGAAGQMLFAFAPTYSVALIARAVTGVGASVLYVGAAKIMAQWFRSTLPVEEKREPY